MVAMKKRFVVAGVVAAAAASLAHPAVRRYLRCLWEGDAEAAFQRELWLLVNTNVQASRALVASLSTQADTLAASAHAASLVGSTEQSLSSAASLEPPSSAASLEPPSSAASLEPPSFAASLEPPSSAASLEPPSAARPSPSTPAPDAPSASGAAKGGYYFFTSTGERMKSKWDSFDPDAAIRELEAGDSAPSTNAAGTASAASVRSAAVKLQRAAHQAGLDVEAVLGQLDQVRGDDARKTARRKLVTEMNGLLKDLDRIRGYADPLTREP